MVTIERPCCDTSLAVELPLPDALRCGECDIGWTVSDPEPELFAPAALAS